MGKLTLKLEIDGQVVQLRGAAGDMDEVRVRLQRFQMAVAALLGDEEADPPVEAARKLGEGELR